MHIKNLFVCLALMATLLLALPGVSLAQEKMNINTATEEELASLPEVGADLAAAIVEYREMNGDFTSTEQLLEIKGITPEKQQKLLKVLGIFGIDGTECSC